MNSFLVTTGDVDHRDLNQFSLVIDIGLFTIQFQLHRLIHPSGGSSAVNPLLNLIQFEGDPVEMSQGRDRVFHPDSPLLLLRLVSWLLRVMRR